ncbi:hypothetical protein C823_002034 [Eubacterium plexicaudatum ASF492]|uniref:Uncharacterized protein n=1 Tax=Eubacterium plexicaudatum ASF492 TaxID=1235802 RepID=N2BLD6_9FIRM|nr:hypothetical protein C823_002034 [Eubacterium plexicaudatum ASF492]
MLSKADKFSAVAGARWLSFKIESLSLALLEGMALGTPELVNGCTDQGVPEPLEELEKLLVIARSQNDCINLNLIYMTLTLNEQNYDKVMNSIAGILF